MTTLRLFDSVETGATFSPCRCYRYELWRTWDASLPLCCFVMLNPSTADEITNDPTVERCERRARSWGYGGLLVVNIFAYRATDPRQMKAATDPVGPDNDAAILEAATRAGLVVCAWGGHGSHLDRSRRVREMLRGAGVKLHALTVTAAGEPGHPLYVPYSVVPVELQSADSCVSGRAGSIGVAKMAPRDVCGTTDA